MPSTATRANQVSTHSYTPPDLTVPDSPAERHSLYSRAILAAVKFMESRLSSSDPDAALDAAKTLIHLEETRLRHDRAVADAPAPKPPSTAPQLPPIRPIRRPDDLVGAEIDCWFGDGMREMLTGTEEEPTAAATDAHVMRKLRDKLTATDPSATWTDDQVAEIFDKLKILHAEEEHSHRPRSTNTPPK